MCWHQAGVCPKDKLNVALAAETQRANTAEWRESQHRGWLMIAVQRAEEAERALFADAEVDEALTARVINAERERDKAYKQAGLAIEDFNEMRERVRKVLRGWSAGAATRTRRLIVEAVEKWEQPDTLPNYKAERDTAQSALATAQGALREIAELTGSGDVNALARAALPEKEGNQK